MKINSKKLKLNKSEIVSLTKNELDQVQGGTYYSCGVCDGNGTATAIGCPTTNECPTQGCSGGGGFQTKYPVDCSNKGTVFAPVVGTFGCDTVSGRSGC